MQAEYDDGGSIGKRYRRQDEIGTPWGVTIDHDSASRTTVTVRERDSLRRSECQWTGWRGDERRVQAPWTPRPS